MSYTTFKIHVLQRLNLWRSEQGMTKFSVLRAVWIPVLLFMFSAIHCPGLPRCPGRICTQAPYSLFWTQCCYAKTETKTDRHTVISTLNLFFIFKQGKINPTEICKIQLSPMEKQVSLWILETVKVDFKNWESILKHCLLKVSQRCVFLQFQVSPQSVHY